MVKFVQEQEGKRLAALHRHHAFHIPRELASMINCAGGGQQRVRMAVGFETQAVAACFSKRLHIVHRLDILQTLAHHSRTELELRNTLRAERQARVAAERLLAEKEELLARNDVLMREIDHRMKNSLQVAASMLGFQARRMPNDIAAQALHDAQRRIAGIAAVHDQLYRTATIDQVDMRAFLCGLCASLAATKPDNIGKIVVNAEPVIVDSERAMKIGLLVTELVMNAFKHAYPANRSGDISIALTSEGAMLRLIVSDHGTGLPDGFCPTTSKGLGMRLIRSIFEQSGGTLTLNKGPGAVFTIDMCIGDFEACATRHSGRNH